ncbi:MAG: DUF983 domain-containing protein [Proteobacteria bacterium]|nr:DUF983 domain-containing protein [Pseudomonadota bacterium]
MTDPIQHPPLPASLSEAARRGITGRCPRCGGAGLFARFLKPASHCHACGQDWRFQRADDFPAYLSMFITGHLLAPVIIVLVRETSLTPLALCAIVLPAAMALMLALLQPAKGAVIAAQWWFGMHGFTKERIEDQRWDPGR